jgi:hypothetical protein
MADSVIVEVRGSWHNREALARFGHWWLLCLYAAKGAEYA